MTSFRPSSVQTRESIGAPVLTADAVMEEEETVGIVFTFDREKPVVVFAPEGLLPMRLEEVSLPHIRANAGQELADRVHRLVHGLGLGPRGCRVWLMARNVWIGGRSAGAADRERERIDDRRVHRCIPGRSDRLSGRAGEPFVEVKLDGPMLRRRDQRVGQALAMIVREKRVRQPDGLEAVPDPTGLPEIGGPEDIVRWRVWTVVRDNQAGSRLERGGVPETACQLADDPRCRNNAEILPGR